MATTGAVTATNADASPAAETLRTELADIMSNPQHPLHAGYHRNDPAVIKEIEGKYQKIYGSGPLQLDGGVSVQAEGPAGQAPTEGSLPAQPAALPSIPAPEGWQWQPGAGEAIADAAQALGIAGADMTEIMRHCFTRYHAAEAGEQPPDEATTAATLRSECAARGEDYDTLILGAQLAALWLPPRLRSELEDPAIGNDPHLIRFLAARGQAMAKAYRDIPVAMEALGKLPVGSMAYREQDRKVSALYQAAYGTRPVVID